MAIDFPNSPIAGVTTYDFLGIRYIYAVGNYWTVATPGSYGLATVAEVNAGTDPAKYIAPLVLSGSDYKKLSEIQAFGDARWLSIANAIAGYLPLHGTADNAANSALLEGSNKAFYRNADNLNAGTISKDRLPPATTTGVGAVEEATSGEMNAGTGGKFPDAATIKAFAENAGNLISGTVPTARLATATTSVRGIARKWELLSGSSEFQGCMLDHESGFKVQWGKTSVGADLLGGNVTKFFTFKTPFTNFIFSAIPTLESDDLGSNLDIDACFGRGVVNRTLSNITMGYDERAGSVQDALFGHLTIGI